MLYPVQFDAPVAGKAMQIYPDRFVLGAASVEISPRQCEMLLRMAERDAIGNASALWGELAQHQRLAGCTANGELQFRRTLETVATSTGKATR